MQSGFTLIEVAIVLVIVGLLLALGANFMSGFMERQRYQAINDKLSAVEESLVRYVSITHHLPCPDTDDDGEANCPDEVGAVPWLELGITKDTVSDGQGGTLLYAVQKDLASHNGMVVKDDVAENIDTELENMGLKVEQETPGGANTVLLDPEKTPMPTGAAYVLMPSGLWKSGTLSVSGGTVTLPKEAISRLIRRPTVAEIAGRANTLDMTPP